MVKSTGSATSVVGVINNKNMSVANLGDSGFMLVRGAFYDKKEKDNFNPCILIKSKPQQHAFNTPFQLTNLPIDE